MPRSPVRWSAISNEERPGHRKWQSDPGPLLTARDWPSAPPLNLRKRIEIVPERECSAARGYIAVGWEPTATTLVCVVGHTPRFPWPGAALSFLPNLLETGPRFALSTGVKERTARSEGRFDRSQERICPEVQWVR